MNNMKNDDVQSSRKHTERLLIYACLIFNEHAVYIFSELEPYHFTDKTWQKVFEITKKLYQRNQDVLDIALDKVIEAGIDKTFLDDLFDDYGISNCSELAIQKAVRWVKEEYIRNSFLYNGATNLQELSQLLEMEFATTNKTITATNIEEHIQAMVEKNTEVIPFPFSRLNSFLGGIKKHEYTIIGARPSVGKSAFLEQCFWHATKLGRKALFVSLEMSEDAIFKRHILRLSGTNLFSELVDMEKRGKLFLQAKEQLKESIIAVGAFSVLEIEQLIKKHEPDMVLIDYLQLIPVSNTRWSDYERTTAITKGLAHLRIKYNTALVVASQYARIKNAQPQLSDLRSSGQIEQDADVVLSLWRDSNEAFEDDNYKRIKIDCLKNRNGITFSNTDTFNMSLAFHASKMSFIDQKDS